MNNQNQQQNPVKPEGNRDEKGRFLPGRPSGNPKGRPRNEESFTNLTRQFLSDIPPDSKDARTRYEKLLETAYAMALGGSFTHFKYLTDRVEGLPRQQVEHSRQVDGLRIVVDVSGEIPTDEGENEEDV